MSLNKTTLKGEFLAAMQAALAVTDPEERETAMNNLADALATAVDNFVRSAVVNTNISVVSVSGVTTGGGVSGPGSGTGTGALS